MARTQKAKRQVEREAPLAGRRIALRRRVELAQGALLAAVGNSNEDKARASRARAPTPWLRGTSCRKARRRPAQEGGPGEGGTVGATSASAQRWRRVPRCKQNMLSAPCARRRRWAARCSAQGTGAQPGALGTREWVPLAANGEREGQPRPSKLQTAHGHQDLTAPNDHKLRH